MPTPQRSLLATLRRDPLAALALLILGTIVLAVILGPLVYTTAYDRLNLQNSLLSPRWDHPLGTNDLGQDQLARLLWGGRISLSIGVAAVAVSVGVGMVLGTVAGFYGGWLDQGIMGFTDLCLSLPQLPLLLLIFYLFRDLARTLLGPEWGIFGLLVLVLGGLTWMPTARLMRSSILSLKHQDFVLAAQALGASTTHIMVRHLLPNGLSPVIVTATLGVGNAILAESTLSFLGLGFPPDLPTWGRMLYDAQNYLSIAPHLALAPGLCIFLTVLSINSLGDGLRDWLDPRSSSHH